MEKTVAEFRTLLERVRTGCPEASAYLDTQKHDVRRQESLDLAGAAAAHDRPAPSLSPLDGLIRREQWDHVLEASPTRYHELLNLLREGPTQRDLAARFGLSEKTVSRMLERVRACIALPRAHPEPAAALRA